MFSMMFQRGVVRKREGEFGKVVRDQERQMQRRVAGISSRALHVAHLRPSLRKRLVLIVTHTKIFHRVYFVSQNLL